MYSVYNWQVDQVGGYYDECVLLVVNLWISVLFLMCEFYEVIFYVVCYLK